MDLEQEFEKETGFEVYDKTNVKYNGAYVEWLESRIEQLTLGGVMPELLCVDTNDSNGLTLYYTYKAIDKDDTYYKVKDNYGDEKWFLKEQFDVLT